MKIRLIMIGKTKEAFVEQGFEMYRKRMAKYLAFETTVIPVLKNTKKMSPLQVKNEEGKLIIKQIRPDQVSILLDENGRSFDSGKFAGFIQQEMNTGVKVINFIVGGAYGFSEEVRQKADFKIALSPMTFSHQIVRIIFMEQLYRAFTIINNEPYHNA